MPNDLKHTEASHFADSNRSAGLLVTQMPRSPKVVIFMPTITTDVQIDHFTPCACAWGNNNYCDNNINLDQNRARYIE